MDTDKNRTEEIPKQRNQAGNAASRGGNIFKATCFTRRGAVSPLFLTSPRARIGAAYRRMYFGKKIVVVMPAYNAAKTVTMTVDEVHAARHRGRNHSGGRPQPG